MITADKISIFTCEHGTTHVRLHDETGAIVAIAAMPPETAAAVMEEIAAGLEQFLEGKITPGGCGHA